MMSIMMIAVIPVCDVVVMHCVITDSMMMMTMMMMMFAMNVIMSMLRRHVVRNCVSLALFVFTLCPVNFVSSIF